MSDIKKFALIPHPGVEHPETKKQGLNSSNMLTHSRRWEGINANF